MDSPAPPTRPHPPPHTRNSGGLARLSILAVDDSRTILEMIHITLATAGFDVHLAEDGQHGMSMLDQARPDAIITDINMPNMDGFEFITAVRARPGFERLPILVLTSESAQDLRRRARLAGATGWIVKPFQPRKLIKALRMVAG
ncbi:response regulator [Pseudooceanicola aestuarii]|uniref:response regulator n=1 Tax=Pseudooceanicola aestuarii TaxID=2697319 RepID=UPI0013D81C88|nr:response regulator [Pseudooceanicola aestuarii]